MLACVDYRYRFFDVVMKWPGSVHDACVFSNSAINHMLRDGRISPRSYHWGWTRGTNMFTWQPSLPTFATFNERISKMNFPRAILWIPFVFSKNGCGMYIWLNKSTFWYSLGTNWFMFENALTAIHACFTFHNFCEMHNDTMPDEFTTAVLMYAREF